MLIGKSRELVLGLLILQSVGVCTVWCMGVRCACYGQPYTVCLSSTYTVFYGLPYTACLHSLVCARLPTLLRALRHCLREIFSLLRALRDVLFTENIFSQRSSLFTASVETSSGNPPTHSIFSNLVYKILCYMSHKIQGWNRWV